MTRALRARILLSGGGVLLFAGGVAAGVLVSIDQGSVPSGELAKALDATTESPSSLDTAPSTAAVERSEAAPAVIVTDQPMSSPEVFNETFDSPDSVNRLDVQIHHRSDHDEQQNLPTNTWPGDHADNGDGTCTGPDEKRTLDALDGASNTYWCDVGTGHFMTSMGDVDGYSTISLSPKQTFATVSEVCWDQNVTDMGGRQWTEVVITPANAIPTFNGESHLGQVNVEFEPVDQTSTHHGPGAFGAKFNSRYDGNRLYHNRVLLDHNPYYSTDTEGQASTGIRRQHCLTDNGNGTVTVAVDQGPGNAPYERTVSGSFPANARVIFEDHNYTPDKDGQANGHYTWHWDNLIITL